MATTVDNPLTRPLSSGRSTIEAMRIRRRAWLGLIVGFVTFGIVSSAAAQSVIDDPGWQIRSFDSTIELDKNLSGGALVTESIRVNFDSAHHGIYRDIPERYSSFDPFSRVNLEIDVLSVTNDSGLAWPYTLQRQSGHVRLVIGDPNQTVSGEQSYLIDYRENNLFRFFADYTELYLDINGNYWEKTLDQVSASIVLPDELAPSVTGLVCYTGFSGSEVSDCTITQNGNIVSIASNGPVQPYSTLSAAIKFQPGIIPEVAFLEKNALILATLTASAVIPLVAWRAVHLFWKKFGKDPKSKRAVVPWYSPPEGLSPLEAGMIVDFKVDNRDITAAIVDLAVRGFIIIKEVETKRLLGKSKKFVLINQSKDTSSLRDFEQTILKGLFTDDSQKEMSLSDLADKFYKSAQSARKQVTQSLMSQNYLATNPQTAGLKLIAVGVALVIVASLLAVAGIFEFGWWIPTSLYLTALIVWAYWPFMSKRTETGVEVLNHLQGLKMYMEVAESDRLKMLQGPETSLVADTTASSPAMTVKLFETLLPYAIALGVEEKWAQKFGSIYTQNPTWYQGHMGAFYPAVIATNLGSFNTSIASIASPPHSSGGSGFGGGGAGGGFGGGGGGAW